MVMLPKDVNSYRLCPMVLLSHDQQPLSCDQHNQVLTKALQVWGLVALNIDSEEVTKAEEPFEAQKEAAFICNLQVGSVGAATLPHRFFFTQHSSGCVDHSSSSSQHIQHPPHPLLRALCPPHPADTPPTPPTHPHTLLTPTPPTHPTPTHTPPHPHTHPTLLTPTPPC